MSSLQCPTADLRQNSENTISQRDKKAVIYSCRDFKAIATSLNSIKVQMLIIILFPAQLLSSKLGECALYRGVFPENIAPLP